MPRGALMGPTTIDVFGRWSYAFCVSFYLVLLAALLCFYMPMLYFARRSTRRETHTSNVMSVTASHPLKGQEELVEKFKKRTGEPFMTQDPLVSYAHVWIIKEAAERAKSTDPKAIRDAAAKLELTSGAAANALYPGKIRYDDRGRRVGAAPIIVQWQGGEPFTVVPANIATRKPIWHGGK